jgi:hypothetical protein
MLGKKHSEFALGKLILANQYLIFSIIICSFIPIIGTQLYFRLDDSAWLLWASEFNKPLLNVFSTDPGINNYNKYAGLSGYYRPFFGIYIILMQNIFGNSPFIFQIVGGLMVIGSIVFMFKITELLSNETSALFSIVIFVVCFHSIMYSQFRMAYPFIYFTQLGCFYFCLLGLVRNKLRYLMLSFVFLLPATTKQSTPLVLNSIILIYFFSYWRTVFPKIKTKLFIMCLTLSSVAIIPLSKRSSGIVKAIVCLDLPGIINYLTERLFFYGDILTTGITGIILYFIIILYLSFIMLKTFRPSNNKYEKYIMLLIPLSLILAYLLTQFEHISIYVLLALLSVSFWVNKTVRCPLVWFSVSLSAFLVVRFYHGGYLLEAAYGLSIAMGMLLYVTINEIKLAIKKNDVIKEKTRAMIIFTVIVATVSGLVLMKTEQMHFLEKIKAVQVLINNNRNFNEMMDYMAAELPSGAIVYELPQVQRAGRYNKSDEVF